MHLIVFDIDGTLADTYDVDTDCFVSAVRGVFGIENVDSDWANYRYVTDSGILAEILEKEDVSPTSEQIRTFKTAFQKNLASAFMKMPGSFSEVPGASQIVNTLLSFDDFQIAFASGGFRETALFKLAKIGIDGAKFPAAFSDDSHERTQIISCAIKRACASGNSFADVTYVGDGVWDARACRDLGIRFIGRAAGPKAEKLKAEGATGVVSHFHFQTFIDLLRRPLVAD